MMEVLFMAALIWEKIEMEKKKNVRNEYLQGRVCVCVWVGSCMGIPTVSTPDLAYCFSADQRRNGGRHGALGWEPGHNKAGKRNSCLDQ